MVTVFQTADPVALALAKGALESAGIPFVSEGEGLQEFPYIVGANPPPTLGPVVAGAPPLLTFTLPAERITVEHELRRGSRFDMRDA